VVGFSKNEGNLGGQVPAEAGVRKASILARKKTVPKAWKVFEKQAFLQGRSLSLTDIESGTLQKGSV
jgi:hypothetical protein